MLDQDSGNSCSDESEAELVHAATSEGTKRRKGTKFKKSKPSKYRRIAPSDSDDDEPCDTGLSAREVHAIATHAAQLVQQRLG